MAKTREKSCGPQLYTEDSQPSSNWPLEKLTQYVHQENQTIQHGEEALAAAYWRLGFALTLVRRQFARGQWQHFLQQQGLEKTRCSKAVAIYRTFQQVEDLAGISVEAAYRQRSRKKTKGTRKAAKRSTTDHQADGDDRTVKPSSTLLEYMQQLQHEADRWTDEAAFALPAEIPPLLAALDQALARLQEIRRALESEVAQD